MGTATIKRPYKGRAAPAPRKPALKPLKPAEGTTLYDASDNSLRKLTASVLDELKKPNTPPSEVILKALVAVREAARK